MNNAIQYKPLLSWGLEPGNRGTLIVVADALARMETADNLAAKCQELETVCGFLVQHLDALVAASAQASDEEGIADLEAKLIAAVTVPIETAAKVERMKRDAVWCRRCHSGLNDLLKLLDREHIETSNAATEETTDAGGGQSVLPGP